MTTIAAAKDLPLTVQPLAPAAGERRASDRRRRATPMWSRFTLFGGRRRAARRTEERAGAFVDLYGPRILSLVLAIVGLNLLDAWFTLLFLAHGGRELNPVVQAVLDYGHPWPFVLLKTLGIGAACTFLVLTKNFRSAKVGLWFVFAGYSALLGWHLYLLRMLDLAS